LSTIHPTALHYYRTQVIRGKALPNTRLHRLTSLILLPPIPVTIHNNHHLATQPFASPTMPPSLEPFPLFIDMAPADAANYFSSSSISRSLRSLSPSPKSRSKAMNNKNRPRVSISRKVENYIKLRYFQYEVTLGLYMLEPVEKCVLNTIVVLVLGSLVVAVGWGLWGVLVGTGVVSGVGESVKGICW
jgi:hypothetical protein